MACSIPFESITDVSTILGKIDLLHLALALGEGGGELVPPHDSFLAPYLIIRVRSGAFRLVFIRDRDARDDFHDVDERLPIGAVLQSDRAAREATLSFRLNPDSVAAVFELPIGATTDRKNLKGRLADPASVLELVG